MNMPRKLFRVIAYKAFIIVMKLRYIPYKNTIQKLQKQARYKHPLIGNKFRKLPEEFANIRKYFIIVRLFIKYKNKA